MQKKHLVALIFLVVVLFAMGIAMGLLLPKISTLSLGPRAYNTSAILQQVQTLSQLVTVKYVIEKVVVLEDVKWIPGLGESRVLMVAHGTVKAGVDLSQLEPADLKISGKKIVIRLPRAQITDTYLDEGQTRVIERTTGLIRTFDKDLEQTARQQAVDDIRRAARSGGILKEAEDRARAQLRSLFGALDFEVEFRSP
jgi:hypothetical protein